MSIEYQGIFISTKGITFIVLIEDSNCLKFKINFYFLSKNSGSLI